MDSGISHAHWTLGELLVGAGHPIEGLESLMRAHRLNPEDPLAHPLCLAIAVGHFTCGDFAEADAWCKRSLGRDKKYQPSHLWSAASQERQGRLQEARRTLSESPEGDVDWLWILSQIRGHAFQSYGEAFATAVRRASMP